MYIDPSTGKQLYKHRKHKQPDIQQRKHKQPVIYADRAQTTSYTRRQSTGNELHRQSTQAQAISFVVSASTGYQLFKQRKHKQPVIYADRAHTTSYTRRQSTSNELHRQSTQAQAISFAVSASTGYQLLKQRKHRQPVIQAALAHATSSTSNPGPDNEQLILQESEAQATSYTGTQAHKRSIGHQLDGQYRQAQLYMQPSYTGSAITNKR